MGQEGNGFGLLPQNTGEVQPYGDEHLLVDFQHKKVSLDQQRLIFTRKEYELLAILVQNAGQIVPRHALLLEVWGYRPEIRTRTLDVHVRRLRKKLGPYAERYIETIFGVGYRFQPFCAPRFLQPAATRPIWAMGA